MDGRKDKVKTVYPLPNTVCGRGIIRSTVCYHVLQTILQSVGHSFKICVCCAPVKINSSSW